MIILLDEGMAFDKNPTYRYNKSPREFKDIGGTFKHIKGTIHQAHSHHYSKPRETQNIITKIKNKSRISPLSPTVPYSN